MLTENLAPSREKLLEKVSRKIKSIQQCKEEKYVSENSFLFFGCAGNGKTYFTNKLIDNVQIQSIVIESWSLDNEAICKYIEKSQEFNDINLILIFRDIDALFIRDEKSETKHHFIQLMKSKSMNKIIIIAETNRLSSLDSKLCELFKNRIYFNFPSENDRLMLLKHSFPNNYLDMIIHKTHRFSFSDLVTLLREINIQPIRRMLQNNNGNIDNIDESIKIVPDENDITISLQNFKSSFPEEEKLKYDEIAIKYTFEILHE
ncbi:hypothetical protein TRFO_04101 [Tritrichomonas foetus]|uniref:ATPase AAA-type core domain-containing protein n=1 Tax=Tritrichomonas foetus TaxID=1144522 RepID=A0A1J4KIF9_9EUKA|nr:hypothetical protein TRFO_04101 [Tritrichomonas foetus]|eukprot:OHT11135.1 hypothetical protein TRFO_04101 [Tritrichomonas foetus]